MTIYFAEGSQKTELSSEQLRAALDSTFQRIQPKKVLALPPDHTRYDSRAGELTCISHQLLGSRLTDVMPALGTHEAMNAKQLEMMFPGLPHSLIREHRWRSDVVRLGIVDSDFVTQATEGAYSKAWPAETNRMLLDGGHDLILSIGQVVPHEVIGMANYTKNIFVGVGGSEGIHESHYLSALYGMERTMGRCDTPLRRILNHADDLFCGDLNIVHALTVVESIADGRKVVRGLYIGDEHEVFNMAGALSGKVNCFRMEEPPKTVVVTMAAHKYSKTWLANKAVYRTRMAIADGGTLVIIAPGVRTFGEDPDVDRLIRKYGYRTTPEILEFVENDRELQANLSAAAHLIHGSSENRFRIVYCTDKMPEAEIRSVGYDFMDATLAREHYPISDNQADGWYQSRDQEPFYYIRDPGLGLWMHTQHPHAF
ncbi:MAG: lactate racemase domain-containing protein [Pirellulaceae bacterium]|nr:lactate racemase domain-containing protein [Pirellulaceae bacterium]